MARRLAIAVTNRRSVRRIYSVCAERLHLAKREFWGHPRAPGSPLPLPSPAAGRPCAVLPALTAAKVLLYRAMREAGVRKADLARRLGWHGPQIDRLLDLNHASRLDQIEAALAALGKRLTVDLADAA